MNFLVILTLVFVLLVPPTAFAQYMGNVGGSGETGKYTLEEALELQRRRIESAEANPSPVSQTLSTDKATLDVKLTYDKIELNSQSKFNIDFINPTTNKIQEHIDYSLSIYKENQAAFGPIPLTHTSTGAVSIPVNLDLGPGIYSINLQVEGVLFQPIPAETVSFDIGVYSKIDTSMGSPILGDPNAPVTIIEFGDYQCHQCYNWYHNTKPEITTNYIQTGKVNLVFVDLAFLGRDSPKAAQATYCAEDQGKYWVYHDILYNSQESQIDNGWASSERLKEFASSLDLDMILFESCLDSEKYAERVQFNISQAREHGVRGTPGFFITSFNNQQQLGGAQPFSVFKQVIDSQLNTYTPTQREWIASGPFQIDKSIYAIGEKIFIRIDGLENYDKGTLIVMRPFNSTHYSEYLAIPFDGAQKSSYNYYIEPQISSAKGINSVSDLVGTWTVIFRDTAFENLQFEVTETIVPATNLNEEQWHEDPYADEAAKIRDEWEKNNQIIPKLDAERTFELDFIESSDFRTLAFNALPGEFGHNPEIRVKTGDTIKIVTTNTGKSFHSFGIVADPEKIDDVLWGSEIAAATNPLKPDETKSSTFVVGAPGTYFYICTVPGHTSQGMQGSFIVESTYDQIPDWLDNLFGWYSTNQVSEDELFTALNYLLKNKIIDVTSDEQGLLPKSVLGADLNEEQWHEDPYADEAAKIRDEWEKNNGQ